MTRGFVGARLCAWMWQKEVNLFLDSLWINFGKVENMECKGRDGSNADAREMQRLGGERGSVEDEKWWNPLRGVTVHSLSRHCRRLSDNSP